MPRPDGRLYEYEKPKRTNPSRAKPKPEHVTVVEPEPEPEPGVPRYPSGHKLHPLHPEHPANKGGRPPSIKATPELVKQVCENIREGLPEESALIRAGITRKGIERWKQLNPSVQLAFDQAEVDFEDKLVRLIVSKAPADAKAAQWLLERRTAARWAQVTKAELTGKNGGPMQHMSLSHTLLATVGGGNGGPVQAAKPVQATDSKSTAGR